MLHDRIEHAELHFGLGPRFRTALEWLAANGASCAAEEPFAVADGVVARPARYVPHAPDPARFEFHRRFADVQFVAEGEEDVLVAPLAETRAAAPFDEAADVGFGTAEGEAVRLRAGEFLVLFPHEAHQPGVAAETGAGKVRKIVVKVEL